MHRGGDCVYGKKKKKSSTCLPPPPPRYRMYLIMTTACSLFQDVFASVISMVVLSCEFIALTVARRHMYYNLATATYSKGCSGVGQQLAKNTRVCASNRICQGLVIILLFFSIAERTINNTDNRHCTSCIISRRECSVDIIYYSFGGTCTYNNI